MKSDSELNTAAKTTLLRDLALELYDANRQFKPMPPWVLVHVLPKINKIGTLYVPDKQNKTIHEAIVLATWASYTDELGIITTPYGIKNTRTIERRSKLATGDHVLFPHWAGLPVSGLDERTYRIVKEQEWATDGEGGIFATVDYDDASTEPVATIRNMIWDCIEAEDMTNARELAALIAARIEDRFLLVDKERKSMTVSGV
jgi:co-chaperonin GroES (HSP10)